MLKQQEQNQCANATQEQRGYGVEAFKRSVGGGIQHSSGPGSQRQRLLITDRARRLL